MSVLTADRGVAANDSFIHTARRTQLVGCAIEVIARLGAERASVVKIAQAAGVSRGVVSYHFRDLDDLHDAVVTEAYRVGGERLRGPVAAAADAREALLVFVSGSLDFYAEHPALIAALHEVFTARRRGTGRSRAETAEHGAELDDVTTLLREGRRAGLFRTVDDALMAETIRAVLDAGRAALARGDDLDHVRGELVASVDALTRVDAPSGKDVS